MAISTTILGRVSLGNKKMILGKSVLSGGVATGEVTVPELRTIDTFMVTVAGAAQQGCATNETFPLDADTNVTVLVETNNSTFYWEATGN